MQCPQDGTQLAMSERSGIEIDYCPTCRGVWLDRGELDKLIQQNSQTAMPVAAAPQPMQPPMHPPVQQLYYPPHNSHHDQEYYKKKKKESCLGELFDF